MKNLAEKFVSKVKKAGETAKDFGRKYAAKAILAGAALTVVSYAANGQNVEANYKTPMESAPNGVIVTQDANPHIKYQSLNAGEEGKIYEGLIMVKPINVFDAPNNHVNYYDKDSLDWEGSGDSNGDNVFDSKDPQAIYMGNSNLRGNVDLKQGVTSNDAVVMENVLAGRLGYLPTDWNRLNSDEKGARFMSMFEENSDIPKKLADLGGDCVSKAAYFSNAGMGIDQVDLLRNNIWDFNENIVELMKTKSCAYNMPVFEVGTEAFQGDGPNGVEVLGGHKINSVFPQGPTTDMTKVVDFWNYLFIEPSIKEIVTPGHLAMRGGDVTIALEAPSDNQMWLREMLYNIDGDSPKIITFSPEFLLTAPSAVDTEFSGEKEKTINYNANIDIEAEGRPGIKTNVDLCSNIAIGEYPYDSYTQNIMDITTIKGEKVPTTNNPELENICYTQDVKTVVSYIQKTHKLFQDHHAPIKQESFTSTVTVDDLEAPVIGIENSNISISKGANPLEAIVVSSTSDNSGLAVSTNSYFNPAYNGGVMEETSTTKTYSVLTDGTDLRGNVSEPIETIVTEDLGTGIEELNAAKSFYLDQNYPNPVSNITTIPYFSYSNVQFELFNTQGETIMEFEAVAGFVGEHEIQINMTRFKPGFYFLSGTSSNKTDRISILKR